MHQSYLLTRLCIFAVRRLCCGGLAATRAFVGRLRSCRRRPDWRDQTFNAVRRVSCGRWLLACCRVVPILCAHPPPLLTACAASVKRTSAQTGVDVEANSCAAQAARRIVACLCLIVAALLGVRAAPVEAHDLRDDLLRTCELPRIKGPILCGTLTLDENPSVALATNKASRDLLTFRGRAFFEKGAYACRRTISPSKV